MYWLQRIEYWADHHHPKWIDYIRILLGLVLMLKGIALVLNHDQVIQNMRASNIDLFSFLVTSQYVIAFYITGGLLIAVGLLTRLITFLEIPILFATIIFIDYHRGLFTLNSELIYSILILGLLIFFFIYGSGNISVDNYLQKHKEED
jgi:uncharacterized membrane protein YphA (DoxX/SURF4 family)